ncbi:MAG: diguanylate cyclase [Gammaproteobacteria bacterium]|nr:diguanylate cyclase [Gammaproteobacteria bacterium]
MVETSDAVIPREPRVPGRRRLTVLFLMVLVLLQGATVAAMLFTQWAPTEAAMVAHINSVVRSTVNETRENADRFLSEAQQALQMARGLVERQLLGVDRRAALVDYFVLQLQSVAHIDALYYATAKGAFVFVKRAAGQPERPADAVYMVKYIGLEAGQRRVRVSWLDAAGQVLESRPVADDDYDPRSRPWFNAARHSDGVIWTEPYVFFTSKSPGVTAAVAVSASATGETETETDADVIGVDVSLTALSDFLARQPVSANGSVSVLDRAGRVLASSSGRAGLAVTETDSVKLIGYEQTGEPAGQAFAALLAQTPQLESLQTQTTYDLEDGEGAYLASFTPFLDQQRWPWLIAVLVRKQSYMGDLQQVQQRSAMVAAAVGVLITLVAFFAGPRLLRPVMVLHDRAVLDVTTGLMNRRSFIEAAEKLMSEALEESFSISLILLEVDDADEVLRAHGEAVADEALRAVAGRIAHAVDEQDLIGRVDEVGIAVMTRGTAPGQADGIARRLRERIGSMPVVIGTRRMPLRVSAGVVECDPSQDTAQSMLHKAELDLQHVRDEAGLGDRSQVALGDASKD